MTQTKQNIILITGADGMVGKALINKLANSNNLVYTLNRGGALNQPNTVNINGDLSDVDSIKIPKIDVAIHLAWAFSKKYQKEKSNYNYLITKNLLGILEKIGCTKIIYLSAQGARKGATSHYFQEKYDIENLIVNSALERKNIIRSPMAFEASFTNRMLAYHLKALSYWPYIFPVPRKQVCLEMAFVDEIVAKIIHYLDTENTTQILIDQLPVSRIENFSSLINNPQFLASMPDRKFFIRGKVGSIIFNYLVEKNKITDFFG